LETMLIAPTAMFIAVLIMSPPLAPPTSAAPTALSFSHSTIAAMIRGRMVIVPLASPAERVLVISFHFEIT
jgi:hypothetical protein